MAVYRLKAHSCIHPETYKYFFDRDVVMDVWKRLEDAYGAIQFNDAFGTLEIVTATLIVRSTRLRNPITVIRRRGCARPQVRHFHDLVGFSEGAHESKIGHGL